jgi:aminoglycoside/choline kinase family phosphotransferase
MLLDDARRHVSDAAREMAIRTYLDLTGAEDAAFRRELAVLGVLNAMRILGRFAQLAYEGKTKYAAFMPREWGHLARNLKHPAVDDARAFVGEVARPYLEHAA